MCKTGRMPLKSYHSSCHAQQGQHDDLDLSIQSDMLYLAANMTNVLFEKSDNSTEFVQ